MTPNRVAYVLKIFPKISETFIAHELAELRRRGIDLCILSLEPPRDELRHEIVTQAGLDAVTHYDVEKFPAILKEFRPQWIHAHFATESTAMARTLAAQLGVPFTFTAHGYDIRRKPPPDFAARAAAARAVITVSEANARYIEKTFGVPRSRLHVIPCGVDTTRFRPSASPASSPPLIVCVARLVKVKNLKLLLRACSALRDRGVPFRCVVVGDGLLRKNLETKRTQLKLEGFVDFAGPAEQEEVLRWWQQASVAVLTSEDEGMPVALMEAGACGVPAVATAVGGIPELIEDGVTGLLATPDDRKSVAKALQRLLENSSLARRMGQAARRRVEEHFSLSRQVDRLLALWSDS